MAGSWIHFQVNAIGSDIFFFQINAIVLNVKREPKREKSGMSPSLCNFPQFTRLDLVLPTLCTMAPQISSLYLYHGTYPLVIISTGLYTPTCLGISSQGEMQ